MQLLAEVTAGEEAPSQPHSYIGYVWCKRKEHQRWIRLWVGGTADGVHYTGAFHPMDAVPRPTFGQAKRDLDNYIRQLKGQARRGSIIGQSRVVTCANALALYREFKGT